MDESLKCECGNDKFWYFWGYVRCPHCLNEYKQTITAYTQPDPNKFIHPTFECWLRRFNNETHSYDKNWEKI